MAAYNLRQGQRLLPCGITKVEEDSIRPAVEPDVGGEDLPNHTRRSLIAISGADRDSRFLSA
jgi:hypothetical protein